MDNRSRLAAFALVAVLAVLGGAAVAALTRGDGSAGATPSPVAQASASASPEASDAPSSDSSPEASTEPSPSGAAASPSASPTGPTASITLTKLRLDAQDDPAGANRVLSFDSQGPGAISVQLRSITPQGSTVMCLSTPTKELGCKTTGEGRLNAKTTKPSESFVVTLRGEGVAQPVVEVTVTFPATDPTLVIDNARFDGTDYPETNGITAIVRPAEEGKLRVQASWGGHPFLYRIDLTHAGETGSDTYAPDQGDVGTDIEFDVQPPGEWQLMLANAESGFGITPMTVTLSWP